MVNLQQNSIEWLKWRASGLGSSDAPIIMGKSPYNTPYGLFLEKLGLKKGQQENFVTELGHRFEGPALALFCLETGVEMEPACIEHRDISELRASFDGINVEKKVFLELKYMGEKNIDLVEKTKAPLEHHKDQLAHLHMVSGFDDCFYAVYGLNPSKTEINRMVIIKLKADWEYVEKVLAPKELEFLKLIRTQTPPELISKDILNQNDAIHISLSRRWKALKAESTKINAELEKIESQLKKLTNTHPLVKCGDLIIKKTTRRGVINYSSIPELATLDIERYRKAPSTVITIKEKSDAQEGDSKIEK